MHRKAVFFLAAVFLIIALVVPPALLILQSDKDLDTIVTFRDNPGLQTSGNVTLTDEINESHTFTFTIAAVIEVVFVILFAVTLYFAISHSHPKH